MSAPLLAALCGALAGLGLFAVSAALWRTGQTHLAALTAEGSLLLALTTLAAFVLLAQPPRRRVRVPLGRTLPSAWLPHESDPIPVLAICGGTPLVAGAAAAALLFH